MRHDDLWFTTSRAIVRLSNRDNGRGLSLIEHELAEGFSPPLHVHRHEDETFYVLEGRIRFQLNGEAHEAGPGDVVHAPAGAVHSFLVTSPGGARTLSITQAGFEEMVREASRPAEHAGLPDQAPPSPAQQALLAQACARNGIDLLGPPLAA